MAQPRSRWSRSELLVAFALYCRLSFGKLHARNPEIIKVAEAIGRTPSALAMKLVNIASLDPQVVASGRGGLANASANDRAMWQEANADWARFAIESHQAMGELGLATPAEPEFDKERQGKDKRVLSKRRIGQAFFRSAVLHAYDARCCITGLATPSLLVASHIVPWRHDRANRLNPRNGMLLSALHDKAFDDGLITVGDDMTVQVSSRLFADRTRFAATAIQDYQGCPIRMPERFAPDPTFLTYHRERVFRP